MRLASKVQRDHAQKVIAKYTRRYMDMRRYRSAKSAVKTLQAYAKLFRVRKMIHSIRCRKLRPIVITLKSLSHLYIPTHQDNPIFLQLTVIDAKLSSEQICEHWRIDSKILFPDCQDLEVPADSRMGFDQKERERITSCYDEVHEFRCAIDEQIIIPAISGQQIIVINVLQQGAGEDIFLGQSCLRFDHIWNSGGEYVMQLKFMEYQPEQRFNSLGRAIKWNMSYFFGLMGKRAEDAKLRAREAINKVDSSSREKGMAISDKCTGVLAIKVDVKKFTHARCGYALGSSPDEVCKLLRYYSDSLSIKLPSSAGKSMNLSRKKKESPNYSMKQLWLVILDDWMYIYQTYGGQLRFLIHLQYCSLSITTVNGDRLGIVVKPSKSDVHGFGYIFPMTFCAQKKREALDWIQAVFTGRRWGEGVHDFDIIWVDIEKAKAKEEKRIDQENERKMTRREKRKK